MTAHWGMPDPAAVHGSDAEIQKAFLDAFVTLHRRIQLLLSLPLASLDLLAIKREIRDIGTK
jgi:arsenate reductase